MKRAADIERKHPKLTHSEALDLVEPLLTMPPRRFYDRVTVNHLRDLAHAQSRYRNQLSHAADDLEHALLRVGPSPVSQRVLVYALCDARLLMLKIEGAPSCPNH